MRLATGVWIRRRTKGITLFLVLQIAACTIPIERNDLATWDTTDTDAKTLPLESGQIIVTSSGDALDVFIGLLTPEYNPYVHAAVISLENGKPYVYEAFGRHWLNPFAASPTDAVSGRIKRVPLFHFLKRYEYIEVWDPAGVDKASVVAFARSHFRRKTPFDPHFDAGDSAALYCTEFVALALEAGGGMPVAPIANRVNRSARILLDWLGIPDRLIQADSLVAGGKQIATLSLVRTRTEITIADEVRREIHRRFTCDQKVGNVFQLTGATVLFREPVQKFSDAARLLFNTTETPQDGRIVRNAVRELANHHFGPFDATVTCL